MWTLRGLVDWSEKDGCRACINDKWVPSRPIDYQVRSFREKLKEAWMVYRGKADCFTWPEGQ